MKQSSTKAAVGRKRQQNGQKTTGPRGQQRSGGMSRRRANSGEENGAKTKNLRSTARGSSEQNGKTTKEGSMNKGSVSGEALLEKFFLDQLKDIYYAEQKITQALPKMIEATTTEVLQDAFEDHLLQTQRHVRRLEKAFEVLGKRAEGKVCEAIEGIIREAETIIRETQEGTMTRDAALIVAAQKVEHYEIATYGGLVQLAITMDLGEVAELLDRTLIEEEDTDALLTEIAENEINLCAEHEGNEYSWAAIVLEQEVPEMEQEGSEAGTEEDTEEKIQ